MSHEKILKDINKEYEIIERFLGGMSNFTYKIKNSTTNEMFVFRIKGNYGEKFVDYNAEKSNLKIIDSLFPYSNTILTIPNKGIKIAKYLDGENLNKIDYLKISDTLKSLHTSGINFYNDYNHMERLNSYEKLHSNKNLLYNELKNNFIDIYKIHLQNFISYPCHNDFQINNIIEKNQEYFLLDWEFSANNDYIYDIAAFGNKDFQDALNLFKVYIKKPTKKDYIKLYGWRFFQCLQWYNVAYAKEEFGLSSELKIDFKKVSLSYLEKASFFYQELIKLI